MSASTPRRERPAATAARVRTGAHRSGRGLVGALVPSVLAVAAVTSLITALAVWQGETPDQPGAAASTTREQAALTTREQAATSRAPATSTPASPTATPTASATPSPTPSVKTTEPVAQDLEVVVLNQTTRSGLAGTVADRLRSSGWEVPAVGNFRGIVPATTVYYPDGAEAAALAVAEALPTAPRVRPRFGNLSTTRLTVVVTSSYPA